MSSSSALLVAIVATLGLCGSSNAFITNDTYFYGQSPTVPSPAITGTGDWATAYAKATAFVSQLTLDEKINMTYGITTTTGCSGQIPAITRLNFSGLCLADAGNGVRATDFVSGFASGLSVGASFNKNLAYQRGLAMGGEFQKKGVNVALGPVVGPLGRIAEGGRNWEGFANDPYLSGKLAAESVKGIQERGVITSLKHFIGNEQETNRNPFTNSSTNVITESTSSNIDDKTIHELYLWPFADAIKEGTANVMCSYNRLNNSYACQNSKSLNGLLKTELGFQGFVVSDWFAQHSGVASTLGGLDMVMPNGGAFWGAQSTLAIQNGTVPMSRLDDQVTRIMAAWYKLGQDSPSQLSPGAGMPLDLTKPHTIVDARDPAARTTIMDGAIEGHVLVKNTGSLPLKSPRQLSIFGYDAQIFNVYNPQPASVSIFQDASWVFSLEGVNQSLITPGFLGAPPVPSTLPQIAINGTMISGGGSGGNTPSYVSAPFTALSQRAMEDGTSLFWDFESQDPNVAGSSDACLVFINAFASEGIDRPGIADTYSDTLVNNVADKCNNTIVIIHNAGVRLVDRFVDHPNVTALVYAHVPGQDSGLAITRLLYGNASFSGKLPYTVGRNESDYGALLEPSLASGDFTFFPQDNFSEGVYIDYRHFDKYNITPRYEFGFGLSYTTFAYSNLSISAVEGANTQPYPAGPILQGGQQDLWDVLYQVQATVTNTGSCAGAEVAQLYINVPGGPIRQLRGFSKVSVSVGKSSLVEFDVMRRDLSEWDVGAQMWKLQRGAYAVSVGASSRILPLTGTINI